MYQRLFCEHESFIQQSNKNQRHDFILSIPIADRPEHLRGCLESIWQLCRLYSYGGMADGFYSKISVVIVEDSKAQSNVDKDIELAAEYLS